MSADLPWRRALPQGHGLGRVRALHVLFCGPGVPTALDGKRRTFECLARGGGTLTCARRPIASSPPPTVGSNLLVWRRSALLASVVCELLVIICSVLKYEFGAILPRPGYLYYLPPAVSVYSGTAVVE